MFLCLYSFKPNLCVTDNSKPVNISFFIGNTVKLWCQPYSNLAQIYWEVNGQPISASNTFLIVSDGLMIFNASADDSGHYTCDSIESTAQRTYRTRHVAYDLKLWAGSGTTASLHEVREKNNTLVAIVVILTLMLVGLVIWNLYKGHLPLPCCPRGMKCEDDHVNGNMNSNNNHANARRHSDFKETDRLATTTGSTVQVSLGCIDGESEIWFSNVAQTKPNGSGFLFAVIQWDSTYSRNDFVSLNEHSLLMSFFNSESGAMIAMPSQDIWAFMAFTGDTEEQKWTSWISKTSQMTQAGLKKMNCSVKEAEEQDLS